MGINTGSVRRPPSFVVFSVHDFFFCWVRVESATAVGICVSACLHLLCAARGAIIRRAWKLGFFHEALEPDLGRGAAAGRGRRGRAHGRWCEGGLAADAVAEETA